MVVGYNEIQILGATSTGGTFDDMASFFQIYFDSDGKFGATLDIEAPTIKLQIVNEHSSKNSYL